MELTLGAPAPDFTLPDQDGNIVRLSDYRGVSNVVIVFYPFAFSEICTGELCSLRDRAGYLADSDAQLLGVSVDTTHALKRFREQEGLRFPLLSDFWPHGAVAQEYGVFLPRFGFASRGTFIVDRSGLLRWSVVNGPGQARDGAAYEAALAQLASPLPSR